MPFIMALAFGIFYIFMIDQENQYLFMGELINVTVLSFAEANAGWGFKDDIVASNPTWKKLSKLTYVWYIMMGITQWIEHRWCSCCLKFEPHFWFDLATILLIEYAIKSITYEQVLRANHA